MVRNGSLREGMLRDSKPSLHFARQGMLLQGLDIITVFVLAKESIRKPFSLHFHVAEKSH